MNKNDDINTNFGAPPINVTPTAPPSYDEAVGGNYVQTNTGLYPSVPFYSSQGIPNYTPLFPAGPPYPSPVSSSYVQSTPPPSYPVQNTTPVAIVAPRPMVGPKALKTVCPSCHKNIVTRTKTKNCAMKYVCCLLMLASVVCALCSCLPFCMCGPVRVEHFCPACNAYLGTYVHS
ncbi:hypothetical protein O3M35_002852 [Rhynocoris fuscipes]|uniref:LITAF domain-containing protein n=1 Tax=Rhynocoris fuscipes TaxID=488301 RepID=A0AAW1CQY0_9HEMI